MAMVFGNGQSRVKVAIGECSYVKNLVSDLESVLAHRRVRGKKAIIRGISQEMITASRVVTNEWGQLGT